MATIFLSLPSRSGSVKCIGKKENLPFGNVYKRNKEIKYDGQIVIFLYNRTLENMFQRLVSGSAEEEQKSLNTPIDLGVVTYDRHILLRCRVSSVMTF